VASNGLDAVGAVLMGSCWVALARAIGTSSGLAATCGAGVQRGTEARLAEVALTGADSVAEQSVAVTAAVDAALGNSLGLPHGPFAGSLLGPVVLLHGEVLLGGVEGPSAGSLLGLQEGSADVVVGVASAVAVADGGPSAGLLLGLQGGTLCVRAGSLLLELQVGTLCVPMGLLGASDRGGILAGGHCAGNSPLGKMAASSQA